MNYKEAAEKLRSNVRILSIKERVMRMREDQKMKIDDEEFKKIGEDQLNIFNSSMIMLSARDLPYTFANITEIIEEIYSFLHKYNYTTFFSRLHAQQCDRALFTLILENNQSMSQLLGWECFYLLNCSLEGSEVVILGSPSSGDSIIQSRDDIAAVIEFAKRSFCKSLIKEVFLFLENIASQKTRIQELLSYSSYFRDLDILLQQCNGVVVDQIEVTTSFLEFILELSKAIEIDQSRYCQEVRRYSNSSRS